jgi:Arc/MetJ-type ribon-helix-helix transcriptional regulator
MSREKLTITVKKSLLEWIDSEVKKFRFRNRSHAFEYAMAKLIESEKDGR